MLGARTGLAGRRVLDLYAGSGAVGLEAASRGAEAVLLVESDPRAARTVRTNIAALELGDVCRLSTARVVTTLAQPPPEPYDVIFVDPPYALSEKELTRTLAALVENSWVSTDAVIVVERSTRSPEPAWPTTMTCEEGRRYGETTLWLARPVVRSPRGEREQDREPEQKGVQ